MDNPLKTSQKDSRKCSSFSFDEPDVNSCSVSQDKIPITKMKIENYLHHWRRTSKSHPGEACLRLTEYNQASFVKTSIRVIVNKARTRGQYVYEYVML